MIIPTSAVYPLDADGVVNLDIRIGSAGLAATDIVVNGQLRVEGHEGHLSLEIGPSAEMKMTRIQCYTTVKGPMGDVPNRIDYTLSGGSRPWEKTLVEDPPDPALDIFYADLFLYTP